MGIIQRIKQVIAAPAAYTGALASPYAQSRHLGIIDAPPLDSGSVSRDEALEVPAILRARTLITTTVARTPLIAAPDTAAPDWLAADQSTFHRMLWTVDDLIFYGSSLWLVERDDDGRAVLAVHCPRGLWSATSDGEITVDGQTVNPAEAVLIEGIHAGILTHGRRAIRDAALIAKAAARVADQPAALVELRQTNSAPMSRDDIQALIESYVAARRGKNSGVSFSSPGVEVHEHAIAKENLLIEGRNAAAIDIARMLNLPAMFIDASVGGMSLSYQNASSRMTELVAFCLSPIMAAIESRLNMADMCPPGTGVMFDIQRIFDGIPTEQPNSINQE